MGTIKKVLRRWREVSLVGLLLMSIGLGWSVLRHDHAALETWYPLLRTEHAVLESWYPFLRDDHAALESWYRPMQDSIDAIGKQQDVFANQLFELTFPAQERYLEQAITTLRRDHALLETWYPGMKERLDAILARCPGK